MVLSPKEVQEDMVATPGEGAPSYSTVKKWAAEFKRGRGSLEDDLVTVTTQTIDMVELPQSWVSPTNVCMQLSTINSKWPKCQLPRMKEELSICYFNSDDDIIAAVDHFLEVQDTDIYKERICMLHDHWTTCVNASRDYAEIHSFDLRPWI